MEEREHLFTRLSSRAGDPTQQSNEAVAVACLSAPSLLHWIAEGLSHKDPKLAGDCAEVLTKVAESDPRLVCPYAEALLTSLQRTNNRIRWEAMHAVALISPYIAERVLAEIDNIQTLMLTDKSTIVRDYAIACLGNAASAGEDAAVVVLPLLKRGIDELGDKFLSKLLTAMTEIAKVMPRLAVEVLMYGYDYEHHSKSSVQKAAKKLIKTAG